MFKLNIKTADKTETIDLSIGIHKVAERLRELGVPTNIPKRVKSMRQPNANISLYSDSDFGNGLIKLLGDNDQLYDVALLDNVLKNVPDEFKDEIERNVLNEQYQNTDELYEGLKNCQKRMASETLTFYCPLIASVQDEEGDCDMDGYYIKRYEDEIAQAIKQYQTPDLEMATYLCDHADLGNKILFAEWGVETLEDTLYGRIDCYLTEKLTDTEIARLKDAITGQNSDGLGEGFEQQDIHIGDTIINVSYWNWGDNYFVRTQSEMESYLQQGSIKFGGE